MSKKLNELIDEAFKAASQTVSFTKKWLEDFWNIVFWKSPIPNSV